MKEIRLISAGLDLKIRRVSHTMFSPPSPNCSAMINPLKRAPPPPRAPSWRFADFRRSLFQKPLLYTIIT